MSRMFHRVFLASAVGVAALAAPATALAAESGPVGAAGAQTPTSVVLHLPQQVRPGQPIMVTARVAALEAARDPGTPQSGKDGSHGKGKGTGRRGGGKGTTKSGGGHRKGTGKADPGHGDTRRHPVTGEVVFFLDGRAEPPAEVSRGLAGEKLDVPLGRHTLLAEYTGDSEYRSARSAPVTFELTAGRPGDGQGQQPQGPSDGGDDGQDPGGYGQDQGGYGQGGYGYGDGQDQYGQDQYGQGQDGPGRYAPEQGSGAPAGADGAADAAV